MIGKTNDVDVSSNEKLSYLKQLWLAQEGGLSVDYRCVRCRDCWACKDADTTEKLSLREEQEDQLIKDSVRLNFSTKSIECTLPVRGSEAEFLTTNKDIAEKVLKSVNNRYCKDENSKSQILASFKKVMDKGYLKLTNQLSAEERAMFESKEVQYYIPHRPVFADSASTPCRIVMDASSRTRKRPDGTGGRCLNDFVVKGSNSNLNLIRLLLRWSVGMFAMSGDIAQFYNACKLDPQQWNLQRFLWQQGLNPEAPIEEGVITTLIYGVKSVAAQSGYSLELLAETVKETDPELYDFLMLCLYVDDLGNSLHALESCLQLAQRTDELFSSVGLECKGWTFTGQDPADRVTKDGLSIGVAGLKWIPKVDAVQVKIPALHFGSRRRGKLDDKTTFFHGEFADMEKFVPEVLTRRMIASKLASIYDIIGKFVPVLIGLKLDLRQVVQLTSSWDEPVHSDLRNKWLQNFWKLEQLRGLNFHRAVMPENAVNTKMRLITGVDAALDALIIGTWGGFRLKDGSWSCKLILGRGLLAPVDSTIPKNELEALTGGSNLSWIVRKALSDWVDSSVLVGDSLIAMCWVISEHKRLSMYHRNRVIQIRRGTDLDSLYHVTSSQNPADIGTRPSKVTLEDVGPNSKWENGEDWMRGDIVEAVEQGTLKPATEIKVTKEMEDEYFKGLLYESQIPEIITKGHAVNTGRVALIQQRAEFSKYPLLPTKYPFQKIVRIYTMVMAFVCKTRKNKRLLGALLREGELLFSVFTCSKSGVTGDVSSLRLVERQDPSKISPIHLIAHLVDNVDASYKRKFNQIQVDRLLEPQETDKYINMALRFLFRKGTAEVKEFNSPEVVRKHMIEKDGILLSRTRMVAGLDYTQTSELNINLGSLGIKFQAPCLDRYSPLSYSIGQHVHWKLAPHRGMETHNRISLEHVHIMQGMSLYRELSQECIRCNMRRKKFLEVRMGGVKPEQLIVAPPFWACQIDLFGPYKTFVPGYERQTRNRQMLECEVWVLAVVCPTTRLVNLQVVEKKDAGGIICGITRLACESGMPKHIFTDQDSGIIAALTGAEVGIRDVNQRLHKEYGIIFTLCPVGGHNQNGQVERVIRSLQQGLDDCGLKKERLHATGLQTLCKIVENTYNSLPIGYSYDRDQDNTEILKIICPNMLKMGHKNQRQLEGPIRLARGVRELLKKVEKLYEAWFLVWRDTVVPKIMFRPKWFNSDKDLEVGDLVYFQKSESKLDQAWTLGRVEQVVRSERDNLIRKVVVKYQNSGEQHPQFTDRHVRKLIKLFNVDEHQVQEDLAELQRKIDALGQRYEGDDVIIADEDANTINDDDQEHSSTPLPSDPVHSSSRSWHDVQLEEGNGQGRGETIGTLPVMSIAAATKQIKKKHCNCCCNQHCQLTFHTLGESKQYIPTKSHLVPCELKSVGSLGDYHDYQEDVEGCDNSENTFAEILRSVTNLNLD